MTTQNKVIQEPIFGKPKTGRLPRAIDALDTDGHPLLIAIAREWLYQGDDARIARVIDAAELISGKGADLVAVWKRELEAFYAEKLCVGHAVSAATDNAERRRIFKSRWPDETDERIARTFPDA